MKRGAATVSPVAWEAVMKCDRTTQLLTALAEDHLDWWTAWRVRRHLRRCAGCASEWERAEGIRRGYQAWPTVAPPARKKERKGLSGDKPGGNKGLPGQ